MSDRFWHGRVIAMKCYLTAPINEAESNGRRLEFLTEASVSAELDLDADGIADLREICSPDVIDAAVLITDDGAKA